MRTSLNEIQLIEQILSTSSKSEDEKKEWRKKLSQDNELNLKVDAQKFAYRLIKIFGRKSLKQDFQKLHHTLMTSTSHRSFQREVHEIYPQ